MTEKTGQQMVLAVRSNRPVQVSRSEQREQISLLDIAGDVASAKLVTPHWTDPGHALEVERRVEDRLGGAERGISGGLSQ